MPLVREGRVWKFGDNLNTDLIQPNRAFLLADEEQRKLVFSANRPGWVDAVEPGDLIVAGENFGMGSGRPIGKLLGLCGIAGIVADSVNGLGLRYCIVYSMPAMTCPGVSRLFREGDRARIDFVSGRVTNLTTGAGRDGAPLPPLLLETVEAGGVIPSLIRDGYIEASPPPIADE